MTWKDGIYLSLVSFGGAFAGWIGQSLIQGIIFLYVGLVLGLELSSQLIKEQWEIKE